MIRHGWSASTGSAGHSVDSAATTSCHQRSRASFHVTSAPLRRCTITCSTLGRRRYRLVGGALERHRLAAPGEGVRGDQQARPAAVQPRGHRLRAVAGEARGVDRPDAHHRERRDHRLRAHRQQDADGVARPNAETLERVGEPAHLRAELAVAQRPHRPVLGLGDDRGLVPAPGREVAGRPRCRRGSGGRPRTSGATRCPSRCRARGGRG